MTLCICSHLLNFDLVFVCIFCGCSQCLCIPPFLVALCHHDVICNADDISEARLRALWVQHTPARFSEQKSQNGQSAESGDAESAAEEIAEAAENNDDGAEAQVDLYEGFDGEPFVRAAAQFNSGNYHGILELLTEAIDEGKSLISL